MPLRDNLSAESDIICNFHSVMVEPEYTMPRAGSGYQLSGQLSSRPLLDAAEIVLPGQVGIDYYDRPLLIRC
jgi:hypothetical protein